MVEFEDAASERMAQLEQEDLESYQRGRLENSSYSYHNETPDHGNEFQSKLPVLLDMVRGIIDGLKQKTFSIENGSDEGTSCNNSSLRSETTDEHLSDQEFVDNELPEAVEMLDFGDIKSNDSPYSDEMPKFAETVVSDSGLKVLSIYCAHMASKWSPVLNSQPIQRNDMSVKGYYDLFLNWKKNLEEVNYIGGEQSYIDDFLYGLKQELAVRIWECKWKPHTLYGAFHRALIEENMIKDDADKVLEEMPQLNSSEIHDPSQMLLQKPTRLNEGDVVDGGVVLPMTDMQVALGSLGDTNVNDTSNGSTKAWFDRAKLIIEVVFGQNVIKKNDSIMVDEMPPIFRVDAKNEQLTAPYVRAPEVFIDGLQRIDGLLVLIFDPGINSLPLTGYVSLTSCEMHDSSTVVLCFGKVMFCINLDGCCLSNNNCDHSKFNVDLDADLEVNEAIEEGITEVYVAITSLTLSVNVLDVVLSSRIGSALFHVQANKHYATSFGEILGKAGLSLRSLSFLAACGVILDDKWLQSVECSKWEQNDSHVLGDILWQKGDLYGQKDFVTSFLYTLQISRGVSESEWFSGSSNNLSKIISKELRCRETPNFLLLSVLELNLKVFDPGILAHSKKKEYKIQPDANESQPYFISSELHLNYSQVYGEFSAYNHIVTKFCCLFKWLKCRDNKMDGALSMWNSEVLFWNCFSKYLFEGENSKILGKLLYCWTVSSNKLINELEFVSSFESRIILLSPLRANFAWDPGICIIFIDILGDKDNFERVGKWIIAMDYRTELAVTKLIQTTFKTYHLALLKFRSVRVADHLFMKFTS